MKSGSGVRYSGYLKMHWSWSVYLALTLFALTAGMFFLDRRAGLLCLAFTCAYYLIILVIYFYYRPRILQSMITFACNYTQTEAAVLRELELPAAIVDREGRLYDLSVPYDTGIPCQLRRKGYQPYV